jgi:hypothetical protein
MVTRKKKEKKSLDKKQEDKWYLNGGGCNPITQNQIKYINRLTRKKMKMYCGAYSYLRYKKDIEELTGEEANNMIRELLAMSEKK